MRDQGKLFWRGTCGIFLYYLGHGIGEVEMICSSIISPCWDLASLPESLSLTGQGPRTAGFCGSGRQHLNLADLDTHLALGSRAC